MIPSRTIRLMAVLAAGLVGCAHCDTCDDFPVPCTGPGCNSALRGVAPAPMMAAPAPFAQPGSDEITPPMPPAMSAPSLPEAPADTGAAAEPEASPNP